MLPGDPEDLHSRYIEATVNGIVIGCLYLPNGNPAPGPKFDYKLRWLDRFALHAAELLASNEPVVLAGDYNVIPTEIDVYKPERWVDDALFRTEVPRCIPSRGGAGLGRRAAQPASRAMRINTFWDYFRDAYKRDAGLRIDHLLVSPSLAGRLTGAGVDREVRGARQAERSRACVDHACVARARRTRARRDGVVAARPRIIGSMPLSTRSRLP